MKKRTLWLSVAAVALLVAVAGGVALWNYHEQPEFCATCHIMEPYLQSWQSSELLAATHAEFDVTCLDCHKPDIGQQVSEVVKFVTGDYETPLEERRLPMEDCLSCHEHDDYAELAEATKDYDRNPHDSHWGEMECGLCHNMHRPSVDYCSQCHAPISQVEGKPGWSTMPKQ